MIFSRRKFLQTTASLAALRGARALLGQAATQPAVALSPRAAALAKTVGAAQWSELANRLRKTNADIRANGLRNFKGSPEKLLTGYPYNEFYDWDLYFENIYLSYYSVWPYCNSNLKLFLDRQQPDGYINRSLTKKRDRQHFKPFMAQLVVLGAHQNNNDFSWLEGNYYNRLKKYLDKWMSYDGDGNGLPTWNSADAAGTDNQWSRAGALASFQDEGVDLASYLVREFDAMAVIATALDKSDDAAEFGAKSAKLARLINSVFWDEKDGFYYDRNEKTGQRVPVKSGSAFMPLFAGVSGPDRAKRIVEEHLLNEKEFWTAYPIASYARTEPDYYQGSNHECNWRGSTWAPYNYMTFHGLIHYGMTDVAGELSRRLFEMAIVKNPVLREYYNAETGEGLGQTRFWGFTALYYVMPLELQLNYNPSDLHSALRPIVRQELGVDFSA
jgi:hypothetical protein